MDRLLIMAKSPRPGYAKTRLGRDIGDAAAAQQAASFLADTLALGRRLPMVQTGFFTPAGQRDDLVERFAAPAEEQTTSGLFNGLDEAIRRSAALGFRRTVLVDGDSPTLPERYLAGAFAALKRSDVVLGPTDDGGYYLIGARRALPAGVLQVDAPSERVFEATAAAVRRAGLSLAVLPPWFDVDTGADLDRLRADLTNLAGAPATAAAIASLGSWARA
jgi:rSAM/selenodomain-associated transferase 1